MNTAIQVTMYLNESDKWRQILQMLRRENVAGASAFHAVGGFNGRNQVHTSGLVEAGGNLPVVIVFVDFEEHVSAGTSQTIRIGAKPADRARKRHD